MKKIFALFVMAVTLVNVAIAQDLSKAEKKRLKDELKAYEKDLAGYKAKMENIHATLDSNDAEIKRLKDDVAYASTKQAEQENKIAALENDLKKAGQEIAIMRGDNVEDADSEVVARVQTRINNAPQKGTVYKVQIGLYKDFNINKYFDQPRFIGYEEVDGMNRYIISYFPDEEVAKAFVADVRKMGIKDAFVTKYIDGVRVYEWSKNPKYKGKKEPATIEEAIEMLKKSAR